MIISLRLNMIIGSYGLFRSMTGVGGRPELILEGAAELDGPWTEIPFKYKPGSVDRPCPFIGNYFINTIWLTRNVIIKTFCWS